jgi:hypothetical protein
MMIKSMGWDYISELRPPTGLLFISQVIYEHGEPWWNDCVDRGKLLILPPELSGNPTSSHLVTSRKNGRKEWEFGFPKYFYSYLQLIFAFRKILRHGAFGFTSPPKEIVLRTFIALKNPSRRPGLNPWTFGVMASTLTLTPPRLITTTLREQV